MLTCNMGLIYQRHHNRSEYVEQCIETDAMWRNYLSPNIHVFSIRQFNVQQFDIRGLLLIHA